MMRKALAMAIISLGALALLAQTAGFSQEQQKQHAKCTAAAEKVQAEVRQLVKLAKSPEFTRDKAKTQVTNVSQAYTAMHEQHKALVEPLNADQSRAVEARKQKMDQACARIRASLKELDLAMALLNPDAKNIVKHAETIEVAMTEWQKEHHAMGQEMGVK